MSEVIFEIVLWVGLLYLPSRIIISIMDVLKVRVGKNIKKLRMIKHLTQQQLAEKINLSTDFVSLIERGERAPSFESLQKIADVLDVKVAKLFEEEK